MRGDDAAKRGAYRVTDKHDADAGRALARRGIFRHQRDGIRDRTAEPDAGDGPQHQQRGEPVGPGACEGEEAEQQRACDDHALAAEAVAKVAKDRGAEHEATKARTKHHAECRLIRVPRFDDRRSGITHDLHIVALDEHEGANPEHQADLETAKPLTLDQSSDIDGCRLRHVSSLWNYGDSVLNTAGLEQIALLP